MLLSSALLPLLAAVGLVQAAPVSVSAVEPRGNTVLWGRGVGYNPYKAQANVDCKDAGAITADVERMKSKGYRYIRLYGTDCDQTEKVGTAAQARGMGIVASVYHLQPAYGQDFNTELDRILAYGQKHGWGGVVAVTIGNEDLTFGRASVDEVVRLTREARNRLRAAGYGGPVAHSDTAAGFRANPAACQPDVSDFIAANVHPFFSGLPASEAAQFVRREIIDLRRVCNREEFVITETGWPHGGNANNQAVPSPDEQRKAVSALKHTFHNNIVLFSAVDDPWKQDGEGTFNAEKYWGLLD